MENKKYKAALFDLDGVIVDTAKYHYLAWRRLANTLDFDISLEDNERFKGVSRMACMEVICDLGNLTLSDDDKVKYATMKNEWYVDYISNMDSTEILPGSESFLKELRDRGIKTALGSASKNAPIILKKLGISDLFDAIVDGNVVSKAKPDPEVFIVGANEVGIDPVDCVVFEDAAAGVEAAHQGNMYAVGIGEKVNLPEADTVVSGLDQFDIDLLF